LEKVYACIVSREYNFYMNSETNCYEILKRNERTLAPAWGSNAAEISVGNFVIGTNLYNNDPESEKLGTEEGTDGMGNSNTGPKYKAWVNGQELF
jgi:hypothetical protein